MSSTAKSILKALAFAVVGLVVLYLVYRSNNADYQAECLLKGIPSEDCSLIDKVVSDVKSANYIWIILSLIIFMISNVSRALRWHIILEPLDYKPKFINSISSIMVAYLSNLGLPRSGEFVRAGVLSKYEGFAPDKVMGTIVLDRITDVIMLIFVIFLTMLLSYDDFYGYLSQNMDTDSLYSKFGNVRILGSLVLISIIGLGLIYKFWNQITSSKIGSKIVNLLVGFKEGILTITKLRQPWLFLFHTLLIWFCYFAMTYVVFFAFEPTAHLGPIAGLVIFVFGTLGIVFPSPGGMGSYHYLVGEGLALYGIESGDAFSFANIIFFSVQLFCNILFGIVSLILLPIVNKHNAKS